MTHDLLRNLCYPIATLTREWGIEKDLTMLFSNLVKLSCKAPRQVVDTR